jgi:hypothetical protein
MSMRRRSASSGPATLEGKPRRPSFEPRDHHRKQVLNLHDVLYAAATGCQCVVKATSDGRLSTVLKAEQPWSPTGVAVRGDVVYVLEYPNAAERADWLPRVKFFTGSCLRGLDQGLGSTRARCSRNRPLEPLCTMARLARGTGRCPDLPVRRNWGVTTGADDSPSLGG